MTILPLQVMWSVRLLVSAYGQPLPWMCSYYTPFACTSHAGRVRLHVHVFSWMHETPGTHQVSRNWPNCSRLSVLHASKMYC